MYKLLIKHLKEVPSTNSYLSELCKKGEVKEYQTVIAENQTAGKGQRGNSWESESGKNLTFSMVIYPTALEAKNHFLISMIAAYTVVETLNNYTNDFSIKWPNDIYWRDKKIGGILIENEWEASYVTQSIIGIGLNVNQKQFHSDAPNPVSLCQILNTEINLTELYDKLLSNLMKSYIVLDKDFLTTDYSIYHLYLKYLYRKKGFHRYRDQAGEFLAQIQTVEKSGHLVLKDQNETLRRYAFKEVEFIL